MFNETAIALETIRVLDGRNWFSSYQNGVMFGADDKNIFTVTIRNRKKRISHTFDVCHTERYIVQMTVEKMMCEIEK